MRRPFAHAVGQHAEVLVEQHDVGRVLGDLGGRLDGDADVGGVQRDCVVDPVAEEGDVHARAPRDLDQPRLLIGPDAREDRGAGNRRGERVVVELLDLAAGQDAVDRDADVAADLGGDGAVVAGDDLDRDAEAGELARWLRPRRPSAGRRTSGTRRAADRFHPRQSAQSSAGRAARRDGDHARAIGEEPLEHAVAAASGTSAQRASTASGAPLVISVTSVRRAYDDRGQLALVIERQ